MICGAPGTAPCPSWEFQVAYAFGLLFLVVVGLFVLIGLYEVGALYFARPVREGEDVSHLMGRNLEIRQSEPEPFEERKAA